ncbi:MAG: endonuclease MutS2 [bacterium]
MPAFSAAILKLEFDKVIDRISSLASSDRGKQLARQIFPSTDLSFIEEELRRVSEGKELLIAEGTVPIDGVKNISGSLKKCVIENHTLGAKELYDIASTLTAARTVAVFFQKRKSTAPELFSMASGITFDRVLEHNILDAIDEEGRVKDSASKDLKRIRQDIFSTSDILRKRLASILRRISEKEIAQEEIITTRDGRMVIPIKVEHKNKLQGFIHSSSASGATVFIEPAETLDINNSITELQLSEQREIYRILSELTKQIAKIKEQLDTTLSLLAALDLVIAKAKYSIQVMGNPPRLLLEPRISLSEARHPVLLQKHKREEVIPLNINLGGKYTTFLITGPNAGGKSVAIKTVGLMVLCTQSGIHLPASLECELSIFKNIFVDIGDDQSIENDLSTFSSHLARLKEILDKADENSLVLIDEIGAGTDPSEGGALAAAVLQSLAERKSISISTTHHGMLKAFAHSTPGMLNCSMEFDQSTLKPTYQFRMGIPGSSYALELAERLELPENIILNARKLVDSNKIKLEDLLSELEKKNQELQIQTKAVERERNHLKFQRQSYEEKILEQKRELKKIRKKAVEDANEILSNIHSTIERAIREIRESSADKKVIRDAKESIDTLSKQIYEQNQTLRESSTSGVLVIGDHVKIKDGSQVGQIEEIKGEDIFVIFNNAKLRVKRNSLVKVDEKSTTGVESKESVYHPEIRNEIDVRGLLGEEAIQVIQRTLDDAVAHGLHRIDIIHGKGTGALRKRVGEFLKEYPFVKSFRLGEWNEGGTGVTVVEIKE